MNWEKRGFDEFSKGTMGNGGQNIYVSAKGVLQRIYNYDVNGDGYPDLVYANSQSMGERPPLFIYEDPLHSAKFWELPSGGSFDGIFADIDGDGLDDLIVACQNNGTHTDITAMIYYGSKEGLSEKYRTELPAPDSTGVAAGDFNGDGRTDLTFLCGNFLRVFYQEPEGISACHYRDFPLGAASLCAADINEDGFCDLYVKREDGGIGILWGGPEGLCAEASAWNTAAESRGRDEAATTTPGRRPAYRGGRVAVVAIDGQKLLFRIDGENILFEKYLDGRFEIAFSLRCPGAVGVSAGDLDGNGFDDIAVAVCRDKNAAEQSVVFWGSADGFSEQKATGFETMSAQSVLIADLTGDGGNQLVVCQGGTSVSHSTESYILQFDRARISRRTAVLQSGDAMRIVAGKTRPGTGLQLVVINHETGRVRGDENIYIYLGGPDGYRADRKIELPGWASVEGAVFDFNDDGYPDVLISNCAENAPHLDPGSFLYIGGPDGLRKDRRIVLPTIRSHGSIVGDFRKCGYLDIVTGGFRNRELRIFRGGPGGYDLEHPEKIVLGPQPEGYEPPIPKTEEEIPSLFSGDNELYNEFGEVRFLFAADFNNDGWLDLFISQIVGPYCYILWGGPDGFGTARMTRLCTDGVASANAADLDGDGWLDLVLGGHMSKGKKSIYESYVTVYWGGPEGFSENRKMQLPANCANSVAIGDFNGDGILDIYATAYNNGRNRDIMSYLYYGQKGGVYSVNSHKLLFNHSGSGCVAGDFNGDGYADLAIACHKKYGNHLSESYVFWGGPEGLSDERKTVLPTVGPHGMSPVDAGNVMDRSDREYYISEIRRLEDGQRIAAVRWEGEIPRSAWVAMEVRCAETREDVESQAWQGMPDGALIQNGEDLSALGLAGRYLQYRLILGAKCACGTPRITAVTVDIESPPAP